MILKLIRVVLVLVLLAGITAGIYYFLSMPEPLPEDTATLAWVNPGPFTVKSEEREYVDPSRPTQANGSFKGSAQRVLEATVWYPTDAAGLLPLVIYSHGFVSHRSGGTYLGRHLASHGYFVIATNYPLTHYNAPGGPLVTDVVNQPGDISVLIDRLLEDDRRMIDPKRMAAIGVSLGGLTSMLAGFHPQLGDERIGAVVSLAGPTYMFTADYFAGSDVPLLSITGDQDVVITYAENAANLLPRLHKGGLVTIKDGSHVAFAHAAEPFMRPFTNPDALACRAITANLDELENVEDNPFEDLASVADGVVFPVEPPPVCAVSPLPETLHPGRQHMIAKASVLSFLDAQFSLSEVRRNAAQRLLAHHLAQDFVEVSVELTGLD